MTSTTANVAIFIPNGTVSTMQDELRDGKVQTAVVVATEAYKGVDSDEQIPVIEYPEDFDNGVETALAYASTTPGKDILVIVTDLKCDDKDKAERLLAASDDMVVIVTVSNDGVDENWAAKLDKDEAGPNNVDVITVEGLRDPSVALAEVGPFLDRASA